MPLWTDVITPVEASGVARDEQYEIETAKGGTLARWLPNVFVDSDHVKFDVHQTGLVDAARYRAFNARPEIGKGPKAKSGTITLPPVSRTEPIDELTQKALRRYSPDRVKKSIENAVRRNVQAMTQRQEWARGQVIRSGSLVVDEDNYFINDNFGRDAALTITAGVGFWWADPAVDRLTQLATWSDVFAGKNNGELPGYMVFGSRAAYNAYAAGAQFRTNVGSSYRPARADEVRSYSDGAQVPDYEVYERSVSIEGTLTKVLDPKCIYFLPPPTSVDNEDGGVLGATYWGRTVSAEFESWGIEESEQPGIVCGVYKEERVGASVEVEGDSIAEPVAANPNASMSIQVLA